MSKEVFVLQTFNDQKQHSLVGVYSNVEAAKETAENWCRSSTNGCHATTAPDWEPDWTEEEDGNRLVVEVENADPSILAGLVIGKVAPRDDSEALEDEFVVPTFMLKDGHKVKVACN